MKIFISWSGEQSKEVAELLKRWLQCVIQSCKPWVSTEDIERGSLWFEEIKKVLDGVTLGIVCLTKENKEKPWIMFEAGALATGLTDKKVMTFLIDLETTDVGQPLAQFNATLPNQEGLLKLVKSINTSLGDNMLAPEVVQNVVGTYWRQFEEGFKIIRKKYKSIENDKEVTKEKSDDEHINSEMLKEVLYSIRNLDRRIRNQEIRSLNSEIRFSSQEENNIHREFDNNITNFSILSKRLRDKVSFRVKQDLDSGMSIDDVAERHGLSISDVLNIRESFMNRR